MQLVSPAFREGERIPVRYTCDGEDFSPPLSWSGLPERTGSLALVCADPDAPRGTWYHWAVFDIPPTLSGLPEAYPRDLQADKIRQAITDFRRRGYGGPCPPKGHGSHRYVFTLYALPDTSLDLPPSADCRAVEAAAAARAMATATLTGVYSR